MPAPPGLAPDAGARRFNLGKRRQTANPAASPPEDDAAPGRHQGLTSKNTNDSQSVRGSTVIKWHVVPRVSKVATRRCPVLYVLLWTCPSCWQLHMSFAGLLRPTQARKAPCGGGRVLLHTEAEAGVQPEDVAA